MYWWTRNGMALLFELCSSGRRGGSSGMLGGRSGMTIIARAPRDCSTSNGIPGRVMCCYAEMGKIVSDIDGGGQVGVPVMDRPHLWFNTSMGTVHYWYWHLTKVPIPVLTLYIGSVPVWARSITATGIPTWCPYWYWHFCTLVQYRYRHSPLPVLAFRCTCTGNGKYVLWISTSMGTFNYQNWNSIVPVPVLARYFCPIPVLARSITGTCMKWCQYWYWHICSFVQYQYRHGTLPVLPLLGAHTGIGILVLLSNTSIGTVHYRYWH